MTKYICSICGYKHEGDKAPGKCPVCLSPSSQFKLDNSEQEVAQDVENKDYANGNPRVAEIDSSIHEHLSSQSTGVEITAQTDKSEDGIETEYEQDMRYVSKEDEEQILEFGEAKLQAVKWYKEKHNCGLKEAKDIVDSVHEKRKILLDEDNEEKSASYTDDDNSGEETVSPVQKGQSYKKSCLTIIGIIALVFFIGGLLNNKSSEADQDNGVVVSEGEVISDTIEENIKSKEYVITYLEETLNKAIKGTVEKALAKYFTKDFIRLYKKVEETDNRILEYGELGFWDFDFWTGGQDGELQSAKVLEVKEMTGSSAVAIVQFLIKYGDYDESKVSNEFQLLFEGDKWRIDDFNNYKWRFKEYLESSVNQQEEVVDSVVADSVSVAE